MLSSLFLRQEFWLASVKNTSHSWAFDWHQLAGKQPSKTSLGPPLLCSGTAFYLFNIQAPDCGTCLSCAVAMSLPGHRPPNTGSTANVNSWLHTGPASSPWICLVIYLLSQALLHSSHWEHLYVPHYFLFLSVYHKDFGLLQKIQEIQYGIQHISSSFQCITFFFNL